MQISINDIRTIFLSRDINVAIEIFERKLRNLEDEARLNFCLKEMIKAFLSFLYDKKGNNNELEFPKEVLDFKENLIEQIKEEKNEREVFKMLNIPDDIRILELKPMKVAYYRAESASPEMDAWEVMLKWVRENKLDDLPATRFFGFNNPGPSPDNLEYGYEVWVTVPDNVQESDKIKFKDFKGGLYCVTCCQLHNISEKWHELIEWVKESDYDFGDHQCLEETISPDKNPGENTQFDLFCPIKKTGKITDSD